MKFETQKKITPTIILFFSVFSLMAGVCIIVGIYFIITVSVIEGIFILILNIPFMLAVLAIYLQANAWYTGYYLEDEKLILRGVYTRKSIPYRDIYGVQELPEERVKQLLDALQAEAARRGNAGDLAGWYKANKKYAELTKFCTLVFVQESRGRSALSERHVKTHDTQSLLLLELNDNSRYLLSPVNRQEFMRFFKMRLV